MVYYSTIRQKRIVVWKSHQANEDFRPKQTAWVIVMPQIKQHLYLHLKFAADRRTTHADSIDSVSGG